MANTLSTEQSQLADILKKAGFENELEAKKGGTAEIKLSHEEYAKLIATGHDLKELTGTDQVEFKNTSNLITQAKANGEAVKAYQASLKEGKNATQADVIAKKVQDAAEDHVIKVSAGFSSEEVKKVIDHLPVLTEAHAGNKEATDKALLDSKPKNSQAPVKTSESPAGPSTLNAHQKVALDDLKPSEGSGLKFAAEKLDGKDSVVAHLTDKQAELLTKTFASTDPKLSQKDVLGSEHITYDAKNKVLIVSDKVTTDDVTKFNKISDSGALDAALGGNAKAANGLLKTVSSVEKPKQDHVAEVSSSELQLPSAVAAHGQGQQRSASRNA